MSERLTDSTLTAHEAEAKVPARAPHLFLLVEGDRPTSGGWRIRLDGVAEVAIGRGADRSSQLSGSSMKLTCPDRRMSSSHARLRSTLAGWELVDAGAKNGCLVNGARVTSAVLRDGDRVELGRTLWLYRADLEHHGGPPVAIASDAPEGATSLLPALARAFERLSAIAAGASPILLTGESGTGKELAARAIHAWSGRSGRLVPVNCGALPAGLVEGELFGYRRGAFTGAVESHRGFVRAAAGGTLFLDEIGDLPLPAQAALLRVLQEREVVPVGETRPIPVDLRLVSASHRDLEAAAANGRFRADLLARLAGYRFELPPLRERREDLGLLLAAILPRFAVDVHLAPEAARALASDPFPLNVRELALTLEAAVALAGPGGDVTLDMLPSHASYEQPVMRSLDDVRSRLVALLELHRGNISAVARSMGKARMQIQRWLKRFDIRPEDYRG